VTAPETVSTFGAVTVLDGHDGHGRSPSPKMNFTVIITVDVRPDRIDEFVAGITTNAIASLRDEPGCLAFDVHRDQASTPGLTSTRSTPMRTPSLSRMAPPRITPSGKPSQRPTELGFTGEAVCQLPARPAAANINSAVPSPKWALVQAPQQRGRNAGHIRVLVDLAVHADPEARRLIREAGRHIGEVLAGAVNLLNPDALVITGDMAKAYDIFLAGLRETVYGNATAATRELQILPSTHGDQSGVIGSAATILDYVLSAEAVDALI
jgi:hypothetical protein